ncbi:MAG: inverse autotransporter beta domain-containing protein, partial [Planctomycetaceae bacterium]|nr:inverse autotransporter beta domain-containing protein [Planctomycetaceae bacterium]
MKPTRIFATASLIVSSIALITAANISVGDEGVVRMSSFTQEGTAPVPSPDTVGNPGVATVQSPPVMQAPPGPYPQPGNYAPYFERSMGATAVVPGVGYQPVQPFGPIMMFESNIDNGLGYGKGYQRFNARVPYHIVPNTTVLLGDVSASVTFDGNPVFNGGAVYRNYDSLRNRVFGWNGFFDYDEGYGNGDWTRVSGGFESLGKYIDFRGNAYFVLGADSALISSTVSPNLAMSGNSIYKMRTNLQENAYSGFDFEAGGPLPLLGRYGMNMYPGVYYLTNGDGGDTTGFQVRWEALITQNVTVNTYLTTDEKFDTNAWVSLQYEIPNYRNRRTLKPRRTPERLMDPVVRANRIQTHIDSVVSPEALVNTATGTAYNMLHVDPNATAAGNGTFESPYNTLQAAAIANNAGVDIIRVDPRTDDTGTNLTVNGGMNLFDDQVLLSSLEDYTIAPNCIIPADVFNPTPLGPLVSDPNMLAGGSVIHLANNNTILGFRFDASNAANTVFGDGVSNAFPITNVNLTNNTFTDYVVGANLQNVSGRVIIDNNQFNGLLGVSDNGLDLSIAAGGTANALISDNTATDNSGVGLNILAQAGSTLNADNPTGTVPTGIVDNTASGNGTGIAIAAETGAVINAVVEGNTAEDNTFDGLQMTSDAGTFNLASLSGNQLNNNIGNGTFIHYLNGGIFNSISEDLDGDGNLDAGEDLNGNGTLDLGIVSNTMSGNEIAGLCIFGEDASVGTFDVGGPRASLGNTFVGNGEGGLLMDLRDTATGQVDALFNTVTGGNSTPGVTIVLDFIDAAQGSVIDANGFQVDPFNLAAYGFNNSQYDVVTNAILATVEDYYRNLPTTADNPLSTIAPGEELNIDFVIGDTGTAPSNGATEYYVVTIGDSPTAPAGLAGLSADIGQIRNKNGQGPGQGLTPVAQANGASAVGVYTNNIVALSPFLNPPNAFGVNEGIHVASPEKSAPYALNALTSGNLTFTRRALGFIVSHELGHAVSLRHIEDSTATTPNGLHPIMGTPAIDLPIQALVEDAEFALSGTNPGEIPGEAPFNQNDVAQLATALGTRVAAGDSKAGIRVTATDSARLLDSTMNNNTITGMSDDGIAVVMNDSAVAEGVTIQGNSITNGGGNGIRLEAN